MNPWPAAGCPMSSMDSRAHWSRIIEPRSRWPASQWIQELL